jgi:hypothetical protein
MITSARIDAVKELGRIGWITCLRAPAIRTFAADDGPLQMSLFDQQDLAELQPPGPTPASAEDEPFGIGVRERTSGWIFTAWIPAPAKTVSNDTVNCPAQSRTRNRKSAARSPRSIAV